MVWILLGRMQNNLVTILVDPSRKAYFQDDAGIPHLIRAF
jgi:hypothetical protein